MNQDKKLTVDDIKKLIKEESGIGDIPNINIFGINVNLDTLKTSLCFSILWIFIWYFFGLFKLNKYSIVFFILLFIIQIFNIFNDPINLETHVDVLTFKEIRQRQKIHTILSITIITFIFLSVLKMNTEYKYQIYKIYIIVIILLIILSNKYDFKNTSRYVQIINTLNENIYNQSIILFTYILYLSFIGISSNDTSK